MTLCNFFMQRGCKSSSEWSTSYINLCLLLLFRLKYVEIVNSKETYDSLGLGGADVTIPSLSDLELRYARGVMRRHIAADLL